MKDNDASSELLREAAAEMRRDSFNGSDPLIDAVADWLEHEADTFDFIGDIFASPAGRVAAAYLDREPDPRDHADEETAHG